MERLANARHLLRTTDRLFEFGAGLEWWLAFVRTEILPAIAGTIMNIDAVKNFVFPLISQIGIEYRNSELSLHADDRHFHVKDGDRMPYFNVDGKSIYDTLRHPCFHLLTFSGSSLDEQYIKAQIDSKYRDLVDVTAFALGPEVTNRLGTDQPFIVLLRPDNYIGCLSPELSARPINSYLSTIMD